MALSELGVRNALASSSGAQGAGSASGWVTGWTIGGGGEWPLSRHWSVRAEYLDFGKVTANASVFDLTHGFNNNVATTVDLTAHIARAAVNDRF